MSTIGTFTSKNGPKMGDSGQKRRLTGHRVVKKGRNSTNLVVEKSITNPLTSLHPQNKVTRPKNVNYRDFYLQKWPNLKSLVKKRSLQHSVKSHTGLVTLFWGCNIINWVVMGKFKKKWVVCMELSCSYRRLIFAAFCQYFVSENASKIMG